MNLGTEKFEAMVFLMCSSDVQYRALKQALLQIKLVGRGEYLTLLQSVYDLLVNIFLEHRRDKSCVGSREDVQVAFAPAPYGWNKYAHRRSNV